MSTTQHTARPITVQSSWTRGLLACGMAAALLYVGLAVAQYALRDGLDPRHHILSLAENGAQGWIQIGSFAITGLLTIAAAAGLRRAIPTGRGSTWVPRFVCLYGVGLIGAAVFTADPAAGFPPGASTRAPTVSGHGIAHFAIAGLGFLAVIAASLIMARRFRGQRRSGWSLYSVATGVALLIAWVSVSAAPGSATTVVFIVAALHASIWVAATCIRNIR